MLFDKSLRVGGIPIHVIRDSGLCPALCVLADQWQATYNSGCPFSASRHWPKNRLWAAILIMVLPIAAFVIIAARWNIAGTIMLGGALIYLFIIWMDSNRLDIKSARKFVRLVRELDEVLKTKHLAGLARLPSNTGHDTDKMHEALKRIMAQIAYQRVFCRETGDDPSGYVWRRAQCQLFEVTLALGFDLGAFSDYWPKAEEEFRKKNPELAGRDHHLDAHAVD